MSTILLRAEKMIKFMLPAECPVLGTFWYQKWWGPRHTIAGCLKNTLLLYINHIRSRTKWKWEAEGGSHVDQLLAAQSWRILPNSWGLWPASSLDVGVWFVSEEASYEYRMGYSSGQVRSGAKHQHLTIILLNEIKPVIDWVLFTLLQKDLRVRNTTSNLSSKLVVVASASCEFSLENNINLNY